MNWINVKDKLPEKKEDILITDGISKRVGFYDPEKKHFFLQISVFTKDQVTLAITHWMPLPALPNVEFNNSIPPYPYSGGSE